MEARISFWPAPALWPVTASSPHSQLTFLCPVPDREALVCVLGLPSSWLLMPFKVGTEPHCTSSHFRHGHRAGQLSASEL